MKKLLKLLATLTLGSVAVNSIVACSITPNAKKDLPQEDFFILDLSDSIYDKVKQNKDYKVLLNPIADHLKIDGINTDEITFNENNIHENEKQQNYIVDITVKKDSKVYKQGTESIEFSLHQSYELSHLINNTSLENITIKNEEYSSKVEAIWKKIESLNANIKEYDLLSSVKMTFDEKHGTISKATVSLKDTYQGKVFGKVDVTLEGKFANKIYLQDVITNTFLPDDIIITNNNFIVNTIWEKIEDWNPKIKEYHLSLAYIWMSYGTEEGVINNVSVWLSDKYQGEVTGQVDITLHGKFANKTYLQDLITNTDLGDVKFTNEKNNKEKAIWEKIAEKNADFKNYIEKHPDFKSHVKIALDEEDGIIVKARLFVDDEYDGDLNGEVYVNLKGELSGKTYLQDIVKNTDLGKFEVRNSARFTDIWKKIVEKNPNIDKLDIAGDIILDLWYKNNEQKCFIKAKIVFSDNYKGDLRGAVNFTLEGTIINDKIS